MSSAFIPTANTSTDGHQSQVPSNGLGYSQIPYFAPVIGQYFSSGAYQFNPAMSNPFPTTQHVPTPMQGMPNIHPSHSQVAQLAPSDPSNPLRLLSSNQFAFYNQNNAKNEFLEVGLSAWRSIYILFLRFRALSSEPVRTIRLSAIQSPARLPNLLEVANPLQAMKIAPQLVQPRQPQRLRKDSSHQRRKSPIEFVVKRTTKLLVNQELDVSYSPNLYCVHKENSGHQRERDLQTENEKLKREVEEWKSRYNALLATYHKQPNHVLNEIQNQKI